MEGPQHLPEDISDHSYPSENNEKDVWFQVANSGSPINGIYDHHSQLQGEFSLPLDNHPLPPGAGHPNSWNTMTADSHRESRRIYMEDFGDYDADLEQELHNEEDDEDDHENTTATNKSSRRKVFFCGCLFSARGLMNVGAIVLLSVGLVTVFAVLPIVSYYHAHQLITQLSVNSGGYNLGGINASGQVPVIVNIPGLIDSTTPTDALTRQGFDGNEYNLVFSDEFSTDGRTFWPGDDPYWEAVDLHYWATGDLEWYDPDAITTVDGKLQITITKESIHDLDYRSGMLQSWNKFCFTGGYIEVSISLPGSPKISGFWPGAWTMGNLARAGYGATTDGTWPYSYNSCDLGTLKNQTTTAGTGPAAALANGGLSYLPGQKLSSCTCAGQNHPGPSVRVGRGAPEIDIIEAQISNTRARGNYGQASQSAQFAPFDDLYTWNQAGANVFNSSISTFNTYKGSLYQEAVSTVTTVDQTAYHNAGGNFQKYGFEYTPGSKGSITWSVGDMASWTMSSDAVGANRVTQISQRLISQEPMSIILNLAISATFQTVDLENLVTPNVLLIDYVRVYQAKGKENIGCSPKDYPTEKYIHDHIEAYTNKNFTTWAQAGYSFPKNSMEGC